MDNISNIFEIIYNALIYTPWWVYVLFFYLLFVGIKASKPNEVPIIKLAIIPAIFLILSIDSLIHQTNLSFSNLLTYSITLIIGIILGYFIAKHIGASVVKKERLTFIVLPGSWLTLTLILIIFASKYYVGFEIGNNPNIIHNLRFTMIMLTIYGITAGLFVGRFIFYLTCANQKQS